MIEIIVISVRSQHDSLSKQHIQYGKILVPQTDLLIRNTKCEEFGSPQIKEVQFTNYRIDKLLEI